MAADRTDELAQIIRNLRSSARPTAGRESMLASNNLDRVWGADQRPRLIIVGTCIVPTRGTWRRLRLAAGSGLPAERKEQRWQR
jgi:hypothetical protein